MEASRGHSASSPLRSETMMANGWNPFRRQQVSCNRPNHAQESVDRRDAGNMLDVARYAPSAESRNPTPSETQARWETWSADLSPLDFSCLDALQHHDLPEMSGLRRSKECFALPPDPLRAPSTSQPPSASMKRKSTEDSTGSNKQSRLRYSSSPWDVQDFETCLGDLTEGFQWPVAEFVDLETLPVLPSRSPTIETRQIDGIADTALAPTAIVGEMPSLEHQDQPSLSVGFEQAPVCEPLHLEDSDLIFLPQDQLPESCLYLSDANIPSPRPFQCPTRHDSVLSERRSPIQSTNTKAPRNPSNFSCATCGKIYPSEMQLEDHAVSQDHRAFRCDKPGCNHTTLRRNLLRRHKNYHKAPRDFECKYCDDYQGIDAFKRQDALDIHMRRIHPKEWETHLTKHCPHPDCEYAKSGFRFTSRPQYRSHMANVHGEGKTDCPVESCKRVGKDGFKRLTDLQRHVETKHPLEMLESPNPLQKTGLV